MDWKDGLTAAVVVGLGYLGFRNVTKGAESFSADSKCDHSNFIGDVCEALSWAEYNCLDCGATQYHEFPLHYENVEALEIIDTDHKIRSDFYARLERDFPDPHDWEAESFEDMKAKWSKHNSCKQYQETGECPHEGCKSAESFSENEYVDGSFVPRGNRKEGFTFYCAACDTRLPLKLRNRSLKIAQEFGMGTGEICRPCVKGIKNLDYISLSAESFSADSYKEEKIARLEKLQDEYYDVCDWIEKRGAYQERDDAVGLMQSASGQTLNESQFRRKERLEKEIANLESEIWDAESLSAEGYKGIPASKIEILKWYVRNGGKAGDFHDLPTDVQIRLQAGNVHELLYQDVNRWLQDNGYNPHMETPDWLSAESFSADLYKGQPCTHEWEEDKVKDWGDGVFTIYVSCKNCGTKSYIEGHADTQSQSHPSPNSPYSEAESFATENWKDFVQDDGKVYVIPKWGSWSVNTKEHLGYGRDGKKWVCKDVIGGSDYGISGYDWPSERSCKRCLKWSENNDYHIITMEDDEDVWEHHYSDKKGAESFSADCQIRDVIRNRWGELDYECGSQDVKVRDIPIPPYSQLCCAKCNDSLWDEAGAIGDAVAEQMYEDDYYGHEHPDGPFEAEYTGNNPCRQGCTHACAECCGCGAESFSAEMPTEWITCPHCKVKGNLMKGTYYTCKSCNGEFYDAESFSADYHSAQAWICEACEKLHKDRRSAKNCCPNPDFICEVCNKNHGNKRFAQSDAVQCCCKHDMGYEIEAYDEGFWATCNECRFTSRENPMPKPKWEAESFSAEAFEDGSFTIPCPRCGEMTLTLTEDLGNRQYYTCTECNQDSPMDFSWERDEVLEEALLTMDKEELIWIIMGNRVGLLQGNYSFAADEEFSAPLAIPPMLTYEDYSKYEGELENIDGRQHFFTYLNMARHAYNALYVAAREKGLTPQEAFTFCTSKWLRHNEEDIELHIEQMWATMFSKDEAIEYADKVIAIESVPRTELWTRVEDYAKLRKEIHEQFYDAESHAYSYAYNDGHSDSRKTGEYHPSLSTPKQEAAFKRILKQKGD
jgi:hypothetical protein